MEIGKIARKDVGERFSAQQVAQIVLEKLQLIMHSKEELLQRKEEKKQMMQQKKAKEKESKQSKITIKIVDDQ